MSLSTRSDWPKHIQHAARLLVRFPWPFLFSVILVILFAYQLSGITLDILSTKYQEHEGAVVHPLSRVSATSATVDYMSISQLHLFGQPAVRPATVLTEEALPETKLKLSLTGIIFRSEPIESSALIGQSTNSQKSYRVGDKLPGNSRLEEIHPDFVVLSRAGKHEKLKLIKKTLDKESVRVTTRPLNSPSGQYDFRQDAQKSRLLANYKQQLMNDPQSLMGAVRVNPVNDGGNLIGYKVRDGKNKSFLRQFGLRNGDVVTSVNGSELNPFIAMEMLQNLETMDEVEIGVVRDGTPLIFQFSTRK